jgi:hypothetical protein
MKFLTIFLLLITQVASGQSDEISRIINDIDFKEDTLLSVYEWVTDNVKYDVNKLSEISDRRRPQKVYNMTEEEFKADKLNDVIKQKKGVCEDYSLLFDAIVKQLGYRSFIVTGMSKDEKGKVNKSLGHAWNAVEVNGVWKLYDTTWGAGYISDKNKFVKNYSTKWYDVSPEEMIRTHLPFDPIWQLSITPISYADFADPKQTIDLYGKMNYTALIDLHFSNDGKLVLQKQIERTSMTGEDVKLIKKYIKSLQSRLDMYEIMNNPNAIQDAMDNCQSGGELFNEYLKNGRNKQFKDKKWTVAYSKERLQASKIKVDAAVTLLSTLDTGSSRSNRMMTKNISNAKDLSERMDKEIVFLEEQSQ